jgi:hypothetical protein
MGDGTFYDIIIQQNGEQLELKVGLIKKMYCAHDKKKHQKHRINKNSLKVFKNVKSAKNEPTNSTRASVRMR